MSDPARDEEVDDLYRRLDEVTGQRDEYKDGYERNTTELSKLRAVLVPSDEAVGALADVIATRSGAWPRALATAVLRALCERAGVKP